MEAIEPSPIKHSNITMYESRAAQLNLEVITSIENKTPQVVKQRKVMRKIEYQQGSSKNVLSPDSLKRSKSIKLERQDVNKFL
jgi:hypothetical protein